jgi:hypothetical protein
MSKSASKLVISAKARYKALQPVGSGEKPDGAVAYAGSATLFELLLLAMLLDRHKQIQNYHKILGDDPGRFAPDH